MKRKIIFVIFISSFFIICFHANVHATEIPKVYFEGDLSNMITKNDERKIYLKYTSSNLNFEKYTKIKIQGSSSIAYEKKNYTINFFEDETYDRKSKVDVGKGWGEQSNYCLKANLVDDKIQARNIVSARIAGKIQKKYGVLNNTPNNGSIDGFPIEVYSNGEFLGLYTWNIPKSEWTWNIDKNNSNQLVLGGDWYTEYTNFKTKLDDFDGTGWEVEIGESNDETVNNFNSLVDFINNSSDEEFKKNFDEYLNKDACLNYVVMLYLIEGVDNTGKNLMLLTFDNGKIWYPCLYDLDGTFGVLWDGKLSESYKILPDEPIYDHSTNNLITRIIKCFPNELANRWFRLRKTIFSKDSILKEFNDFENSIPEETIKKEGEKWKDSPGYDMSQINDFLDVRLSYIDSIMKEKQYSYIYKAKRFLTLFLKCNNLFCIV